MEYTPDAVAQIEAIRSLCSRYSRGVDRFDLMERLACFAEDAIFDLSAMGLGVHKGSKNLKAYFSHNLNTMAHQMHLSSNFIIEIDGPEDAHGTSYLFTEGLTKKGDVVRSHAFNEDIYIKQGKEWLISRRICSPLLPPKLEFFAAARNGG